MDNSIEKKLIALEKLQEIDSKLDAILKVRGDLPDEIQDLEDDVIGLETRREKFKNEVVVLEQKISDFKTNMKNAEALIKKYEAQQMEVRNNREYDAITKEIELQQLEIQVCEKKIKESRFAIENKQKEIEEIGEAYENRKKDLAGKQEELRVITEESQEEENKYLAEREAAAKKIDERLYKSYARIRVNAKNGLAVVSIKRNACGGCFNTVPPQRQADVKERKKIIVCEHCGRILSNVTYIEEEEVPVKRASRKKLEIE